MILLVVLIISNNLLFLPLDYYIFYYLLRNSRAGYLLLLWVLSRRLRQTFCSTHTQWNSLAASSWRWILVWVCRLTQVAYQWALALCTGSQAVWVLAHVCSSIILLFLGHNLIRLILQMLFYCDFTFLHRQVLGENVLLVIDVGVFRIMLINWYWLQILLSSLVCWLILKVRIE